MKHYTATLTGGVDNLAALVLAADSPGLRKQAGQNDPKLQHIVFQPDAANTHVVYLGDASSVTPAGVLSATNYGFRLEVPLAGPIPQAPLPLQLDGKGRLGDWYAFGTAGEKVRIVVIPYA